MTYFIYKEDKKGSTYFGNEKPTLEKGRKLEGSGGGLLVGVSISVEGNRGGLHKNIQFCRPN